MPGLLTPSGGGGGQPSSRLTPQLLAALGKLLAPEVEGMTYQGQYHPATRGEVPFVGAGGTMDPRATAEFIADAFWKLKKQGKELGGWDDFVSQYYGIVRGVDSPQMLRAMAKPPEAPLNLPPDGPFPRQVEKSFRSRQKQLTDLNKQEWKQGRTDLEQLADLHRRNARKFGDEARKQSEGSLIQRMLAEKATRSAHEARAAAPWQLSKSGQRAVDDWAKRNPPPASPSSGPGFEMLAREAARARSGR